MKDIFGEDLIFAIALVIQNLENIQNKLEDQIIDELCKYMKSEIFIISSESGENINKDAIDSDNNSLLLLIFHYSQIPNL